MKAEGYILKQILEKVVLSNIGNIVGVVQDPPDLAPASHTDRACATWFTIYRDLRRFS